MRSYTLLVSIALSLFIPLFVYANDEKSSCEVLVRSPPTYQVGDHTPFRTKEIGDIGYNPEVVKYLTNNPKNERQVVDAIDHDFVDIQNISPDGRVSSVVVFNPKTQQVLYPQTKLLVSVNVRFPICAGDTFQKVYESSRLEKLVHECGPVKRDEKSGYIFFPCRGPTPMTVTQGVEVETTLVEIYVYTDDLKWQVIPALDMLYVKAKHPDSSHK